MKEDALLGNFEFASVNQLKGHTTSRRDDLISLSYLLVYFFKRGKIPESSDSQNIVYGNNKKDYRASLEELCYDNTEDLKEFMTEVFSYRFKDTPRYDYLRDILVSLRNGNTTPPLQWAFSNVMSKIK